MSPGTLGQRPRPVRQLPEPSRLWIVYSPRLWRSVSHAWTDFAKGRLGGLKPRTAEPAPLPEVDYSNLDDLFHLPPVDPRQAAERDALARSMAESGVGVLLQLEPGENDPRHPGITVVYDLLRPLLLGEVEQLRSVARGASVVWPLIAGLTDPPEMWEEGALSLVAAGARTVQPMAVELSPFDRRLLAEGRDEDVFDALFHGPEPSEREFSRHMARHGFEPFVERPTTGGLPRLQRNRRLAAELALLGELHLRLEKSVSFGQALFRAARGAEQTSHDLTALVREHNLKVMTWLDAASRELIREIVENGTTELHRELVDEHLGC